MRLVHSIAVKSVREGIRVQGFAINVALDGEMKPSVWRDSAGKDTELMTLLREALLEIDVEPVSIENNVLVLACSWQQKHDVRRILRQVFRGFDIEDVRWSSRQPHLGPRN